MLAQRLYLRNPSVTHSECLIFTNNHTIRDTAQVPLNHACSLCGGSDHCLLGVPRQNALRWLLSHTLPRECFCRAFPDPRLHPVRGVLCYNGYMVQPLPKPNLFSQMLVLRIQLLVSAKLLQHLTQGNPNLDTHTFNPIFRSWFQNSSLNVSVCCILKF